MIGKKPFKVAFSSEVQLIQLGDNLKGVFAQLAPANLQPKLTLRRANIDKENTFSSF